MGIKSLVRDRHIWETFEIDSLLVKIIQNPRGMNLGRETSRLFITEEVWVTPLKLEYFLVRADETFLLKPNKPISNIARNWFLGENFVCREILKLCKTSLYNKA